MALELHRKVTDYLVTIVLLSAELSFGRAVKISSIDVEKYASKLFDFFVVFNQLVY